MKKKTKVIALFLQYDTEKYPCALHYFKKYLAGIGKADVEIIVVDNKCEVGFPKVFDNNITMINGDNSLWEFSGWQKGLEYIYDNKIDYDVIIFANDSFLAPAGGGTDLSGLINDDSIKKASKNAMVGQFCSIDEGITINGIYIYNYVRTHCFLLSRQIIEKIKCIPTVDYNFLNKCISEKPSKRYFNKDAPLSMGFQKYIIGHLTKRWHSKLNIFDNWDLYRGKILAYLNEMLLTAKVRDLIQIV
jgi:hypothetical protein